MFSGHTHRDMTEMHNYYDPTSENSTLPNYLFNTAAVSYLGTGFYDDGVSREFAKSWHAQTYQLYGETHQKWNSSKGYYLRVYENCIEIYGREYSTSQWVPNAMYRIVTAEHVHTGELECSNVCKYCNESITPKSAHVGEHGCSELCKYGCNTKVTPTADHSFGDWIVLSQPTADKDGEQIRTCTLCKALEIEKIPATGAQEKPTDTQATDNTEKPTDTQATDPSDTQQTTSTTQPTASSTEANSGGCGGAIGGAAVLAIAVAALGVGVTLKKKD